MERITYGARCSVLGDLVVDEFVTYGRCDQLPELLLAKFEGIADGVVLPPLGNDDDQLIRTCVRRLQRESAGRDAKRSVTERV